MSITIVQKSDLNRPKKNPRIALVLSGGAISGGAFKLGGLIALNRFIQNRKVTDFDMYVCLSAGAFVGTFLAGGVPPEELLRSLDGTATRMAQFKFYDFYWPAFGEFGRRGTRLAKDAIRLGPSVVQAAFRHVSGNREKVRRRVMDFLADPGYTSLEKIIGPLVSEILEATPLPHVGRYIPAGMFDNSRIERFISENLRLSNIPNDFRQLNRQRHNSLYIIATNLNTARGVVFGHDADHTVSISEAVQASTALPGFYVPPRIRGEEYLDAMVRKTANASLAVHKGADLIIIYNPFRPFMNRSRYQLSPSARGLSELGMGTVLNQTIRTMVHTRLHLGIERLRANPAFRGDVVLIEPTETDADFFTLNPLAFWNRRTAARQGFNSVRRAIEQNVGEVERVLAAYGMECDLGALSDDLDVIRPEGSETPGEDSASQKSPTRPRLRVVRPMVG
jgi:predicted acylesterase/phospholipase RssA